MWYRVGLRGSNNSEAEMSSSAWMHFDRSNGRKQNLNKDKILSYTLPLVDIPLCVHVRVQYYRQGESMNTVETYTR